MLPLRDARDGLSNSATLRVRPADCCVSVKILLDECVPWPMFRLLAGHECTTAQKRGWGGIKNGELLQLAEIEFDLFVTADQNLRYQQSLGGRSIRILELSTNDLRRIRAAATELQAAVAGLRPGEFRHLALP